MDPETTMVDTKVFLTELTHRPNGGGTEVEGGRGTW